jgi:hypothetical protein
MKDAPPAPSAIAARSVKPRVVLERVERRGDGGVAMGVVELVLRPVPEAGLVGEELTRRDWPRLLGEAGHVALDGRVEIELAALEELEDRGAGDRLRDGGQAVDARGRRGKVVLDVGQAVARRPAQFALADDGSGEAGNLETRHGGEDRVLDRGRASDRQVAQPGSDDGRGGRRRRRRRHAGRGRRRRRWGRGGRGRGLGLGGGGGRGGDGQQHGQAGRPHPATPANRGPSASWAGIPR